MEYKECFHQNIECKYNNSSYISTNDQLTTFYIPQNTNCISLEGLISFRIEPLIPIKIDPLYSDIKAKDRLQLSSLYVTTRLFVAGCNGCIIWDNEIENGLVLPSCEIIDVSIPFSQPLHLCKCMDDITVGIEIIKIRDNCRRRVNISNLLTTMKVSWLTKRKEMPCISCV